MPKSLRVPRAVLDYRLLRKVMTLVPWPMRTRLIVLLAFTLIVSLLDMVAVAAVLPLVQLLMADELPVVVQDYVIPVVGIDDRQSLLVLIAVLICVAFLAKNIALIVIRWLSLGITTKASAAAQAELLKRYLSAPFASHRRRSRAGILQAVTAAVPGSFGAVLLGYISAITDGILIGALLAVLLILAPQASLLAAVFFGGTALLLARVIKPHALSLGLQSLDIGQASWRQLNPAIEGFRETRIFQREALFLEQYRANRQRSARVSRLQGMFGELPKYILETAMIIGMAVVAAILLATYESSTAIGLLVVFAAAAMRIVPALNRLVATTSGIRAGEANLEFVAEQIDMLARDEAVDIDARGPLDAVPDGDIVVSNLSYRYPDASEDVLSGVSVSIERGSVVALVGSSGAGKTTFADLLTGLLMPTSGSIEAGGMNIAQESRRWMQELAVVSQRVYLWEAPVRDLITFGQNPDLVDEALLADVLTKARLEELIAELPRGMDTLIGDNGARLSGGQIQRIGIARALYAKPRVLILDEATSALDNETEHEITQTIERLHGDVTVIVIAHRLSTVKDADEILFFSAGELQDRGTMSELRARQPEFARLVELGSLA